MTRVFRRGELPLAVLEVLGGDGPLHGYGVLAALRERVGGTWRASPGSVYPALLALEDEGLVSGIDRDDARVYSITSKGRSVLASRGGVLGGAHRRAIEQADRPTLGERLDRFAAAAPGRSTRLDDASAAVVDVVLDDTARALAVILAGAAPATTDRTPMTKGDSHG